MITRLGHIAIRTSDILNSVKFYVDVLGLQEAFRMYGDDGGLATVYIYVAPNQFLELFANGKKTCERGNDVIGMVHICLEVPDIKAAYEEMQEKGAPLDSEIRLGNAKCKLFWTHDPDGNPVELMELPPESLQAQATKRIAQEQRPKY